MRRVTLKTHTVFKCGITADFIETWYEFLGLKLFYSKVVVDLGIDLIYLKKSLTLN